MRQDNKKMASVGYREVLGGRSFRGFTLIELLVVVAIIAMLMSILMPSLNSARTRAKSLVCRGNLKQFSLVFTMYAADNKSKFQDMRDNTKIPSWLDLWEPYYVDAKLMRCPGAIKPRNIDATPGASSLGGKNLSWGIFTGTSGNKWDKAGAFGSYGINEWINNPSVASPRGGAARYWRTINAAFPDRIPVMADSWFIGGWPHHTNSPPPYDGHVDANDAYEMGRFCLNRHNKAVNVIFMDSSVRSVGLKGLWRLKWHKEYNLNARLPNWRIEAPWMENFPE